MRIVELHFSGEEIEKVVEVTDDRQKVEQAIGRLVSWAVEGFPKVSIFCLPKDAEFTAVYFKEDGTRGYVINAVWHDDHYGFHS